MLKITALFFIFTGCIIYSQSSITGNYFIGENQVKISSDFEYYYILYETDGSKRILQYEENTPENDQIWLEYRDAKQTGTLVLKPDYSGGIYTDYRTNAEFIIKRKEQ